MTVPERIHVEVVIDSLTSGGAEMLLGDFAAAAPAAGLDVTVSYLEHKHPSPALGRLQARGVDPVLVPFSNLHHPGGIRRMRAHLARVKPDVVHTHLGYSDWFGGIAARTLGIPSVATVHLMAWETHSAADRVKLQLMSRARRHLAHRVVTVSERARQAYLDAGLDRPGHVVAVHNGIADEAIPGTGAAVRAELGLAPDDLVVGMMTVLRAGKGHDVAIAAVDRLRERFPRLRLLIAGDGPARAEVERLAAPLGDAAVVAGHRDDVLATLDALDVLLHPTEIDAFPTALMEAMAARVPVVATAVGGIPEIVDPGVTGVLVGPPATAGNVAEALAPLLADALTRRRMGEAGRARFEAEFEARIWVRRLRDLYEAARAA